MKRSERSWDSYLAKQLKNPKVKQDFEAESKALNIGIELARQRERKGLTQEDVARRIGTSAPQVSRTERNPEHANVRTLQRCAEAVGMRLDIRLVAK